MNRAREKVHPYLRLLQNHLRIHSMPPASQGIVLMQLVEVLSQKYLINLSREIKKMKIKKRKKRKKSRKNLDLSLNYI